MVYGMNCSVTTKLIMSEQFLELRCEVFLMVLVLLISVYGSHRTLIFMAGCPIEHYSNLNMTLFSNKTDAQASELARAAMVLT